MEKALSHYGVLGMKWGVRKDRPPPVTYRKAPEGGSIKRQLDVIRAKDAIRMAKGSEAKKEAIAEHKKAKETLERGFKEYRAFEKAMYKKSKSGALLKPFEKEGAEDYIVRVRTDIGMGVVNSLLLGGCGALFVYALK